MNPHATILLALAILATAQAATAQTVKVGPEDLTCDHRPLTRPHVLSRQGKEADLLKVVWSFATNEMSYSTTAPVVAYTLTRCLEKAQSQSKSWDAVAGLDLEILSRPETKERFVVTRFQDEELRLEAYYDTATWDLARQIVDWTVATAARTGRGKAEQQRLHDALWTLWVESYLATLPRTHLGVDLRKYYGYTYVDQLEQAQGAPAPRHEPGFQPFLSGGMPLAGKDKLFVRAVLDPKLRAAGVVGGQEVTHFNGVPFGEHDRGRLLDWWAREEPFEYSFRVAGREEPIRASSLPAPPWDTAYGYVGPVGYLRIAYFGDKTTETFRDVFGPSMAGDGVRSLIIDLRGNTGGKTQLEFLDLFLRPGDPTSTRQRVQQTPIHTRRRPLTGPFYDVPLVVLIDGETASMAEIFAAAVRANERGVLVGESTWGKGITQNIYSFDEGALLLPHEVLYYPDTVESWYVGGVTPDIEVEPGTDRDKVEAMLRRPVLDLNAQLMVDPVFQRAFRLLILGDPEWQRLLGPYRRREESSEE